MFGIIGSGFGLYGYLPALVHLGEEKVVLPATSREKLLSRPDLKKYFDKIHWVENNDDLIAKVSNLVIAVTPKAQESLIDKILKTKNNLQNLYIEKPVASNPTLSQTLLLKLYEKNIDVKIAYLFRHTDWGKSLFKTLQNLSSTCQVELTWDFKAHHIENNIKSWKSIEEEGGGLIRFYGIHILALLAEVGYCEIEFSRTKLNVAGETEGWSSKFTGNNLPDFSVKIDINSEISKFQFFIKDNKNNITEVFERRDPFAKEFRINGKDDHRVPFLIDYINDMDDINKKNRWYLKVTPLWNKVEIINIVQAQINE